MPRRVATPPTVPVTISKLGMARQALSGKILLAGCNDEILKLDGGLDGPVVFNSATGNCEVGTSFAPTSVQDNYACADENLSGLLLMGKDPGCREPGQNPDRDIVAVRLTESSTADILGVIKQCATAPGRAPEITPVTITPTALTVVNNGSVIPNPKVIGFTEESALDCNNIRRTIRNWFSWSHWHQPVVEGIESSDTAEPGDTQNLWFAAWKKVTDGTNTTKKLVQLTKDNLISLINDTVVASSPFTFVRPRPEVMSSYQYTTFAPVNVNVNLTTQPNYSESATAVQFTVLLESHTNTSHYKIVFTADDEEFGRATLGVTGAGDSDTNTFIVPIPGSKQINFKLIQYIDTAGTILQNFCVVHLDAFIR